MDDLDTEPVRRNTQVRPGKRKMQLVVTDAFHDAVSEQAAAEGTTMTAVMVKATNAYIERRRARRAAG